MRSVLLQKVSRLGSVAVVTVLALAVASVAQDALDANLSTAGTRNLRSAPTTRTMGTSIYTLDRHTGQMRYNRANAFNDPSYNIYERRFSKYDSPPGQGTRSATGLSQRGYQTARHRQPSQSQGMAQNRYSAGRSSPSRVSTRHSAGRMNTRR